jgi:hypothetical protein
MNKESEEKKKCKNGRKEGGKNARKGHFQASSGKQWILSSIRTK